MIEDQANAQAPASTASKIYSGPNPFSRAPVLALRLDLNDPASPIAASVPLPRLRHLLAHFGPGWLDDYAGHSGPSTGLEAASIIAHWTRHLLNCERGLVRAAGATELSAQHIALWIGYHKPSLSRAALQIGLDLARRTSNPQPLAPHEIETIGQIIAQLKLRCRHEHPDYIARILMLTADEKKIPHAKSPVLDRIMQYGWGRNARRFIEAMPQEESYLGFQIAKNKYLTAKALRQWGYPTPRHHVANTLQQAEQKAGELGWPLAVKPLGEGQGRGITTHVTSRETLAQAFSFAQDDSKRPVLIEQMIEGDDHRLLVLEGRLVAVARREPPRVTGDGISNLNQLIAIENKRRQAVPVSSRYFKQLAPTPTMHSILAAQNLTLHSIPFAGQIVALRGNANISTGGTAINVSDNIHPALREMAENIATNLNLKAMGLDYITTDISRPWWETGGTIIEINTTPGIDVHLITDMKDTDIGAATLGDTPARIPIVIIIAGKARQTMLSDRLREMLQSDRPRDPRIIAIMDHDRTTISLQHISSGQNSMPSRVSGLLSNNLVDAALICVTPDEVIDHGFPIDHASLTILDHEASNHDYLRALSADSTTTQILCPRAEDWAAHDQIETIQKALATPPTGPQDTTAITPDRLLAAQDPAFS